MNASDLHYVAVRLAKDALLRIPGLSGLDFGRHGQRTGRMYDTDYIRNILNIHLEQWEKNGGQVKGARFLEMGPGNSLGQAFLLCLLGAECVTAVDVRRYADAKSGGGVYEAIVDQLPIWLKNGGLSGVPVNVHFRKRAAELLPPGRRFPELDHRLRYLSTDGSALPLGSVSVDRMYSCSVLEHVTDPFASYREQHRVLARGGLASHIIDLRDHHHSDPFHFLRFSDTMWALMQKRSAGATNRMRRVDHLRMIGEAGLEVVAERRKVADQPPPAQDLSERFRHYDPDDLRTLTMTVLLRKS